MTNDKKQPGLPVVEVDQAFPLMTTDGVSRPATSAGTGGDQGPTVTAAIRDVLGWRPRVEDPKAFTAALSASFELSTVEDHVIARYVPRGVAVQADLGGVTGGQASLYLRAKAAHEQITRMLDSLQPLRTDADPQDCEAYRGLVRDSVRRIVMELGREGGPRVPLVDSAFSVLTGYQPADSPGSAQAPAKGMGGFTAGPVTGTPPTFSAKLAPKASFAIRGGTPGTVPAAVAEVDPDTVPGQLGALRDRFGLDDDHVNTVDEEKQRTSFWTLVELITDLQRSWDLRRLDFTLGAGNGFLGTDLVQISRLLAAAAEQLDEFEAVLDSVFVSAAERQTVVLDPKSGLTLDDLVQWLRVFFTEDGKNIIRDTGRDGLVSSFTPTAVALLLTLRQKLVRTLVPCGGAGCAGGCTCGSSGLVRCIPLGCHTQMPPGMYAGRVKIAVSTLCGLVERLTSKAIRIGRFAGAVLLDLSVVPFADTVGAGDDFVRAEVRGLHLRPTYVPAFVAEGGNETNLGSLVLPLQGSASGDADRLSGVFQRDALPGALQALLTAAGNRGVLMAASEVPLTIIDGELGRVVQGPAVTTWPRLQPAGVVAGDGGPDRWDSIAPNQRFVPQTPPNPVAPKVADLWPVAAGPRVTGVFPDGGLEAGGDPVTITGSRFAGATDVRFGTTGAAGARVESDTEITAISPPGTGTVDITVTTPAGTSVTSPADRFTYTSAGPRVTGVFPDRGAKAGGDPVIIIGSGFTGATDVRFGTADATISVESDTEITATSPAGTGRVEITVTTPAGTSATGPADHFTYTGYVAEGGKEYKPGGVREDQAKEGQPLSGESRSPAVAEALRRVRETLDEDSSLPLEGQVRKIQLRGVVKDFLVAVLQQQPPALAPKDTKTAAAADTAADAEDDKDGREK